MNDNQANALFTGVVMMFHSAGMQHLGKVKNPTTDAIERNLPQAQMSIDILDMLQTKCKGNLTQDEERYLRTALQELKLNYVDEVSKEPTPTAK
jgi:hypothetical protein